MRPSPLWPSGSLPLRPRRGHAPGNDDRHPEAPTLFNFNRLVGLTRSGHAFDFAANVFSTSEFAGPCFSPDGRILFVNLQGNSVPGSGMTCAITGPWERGAL